MKRQLNRSIPLSWILSLLLIAIISGAGIYFVRSFLSDPYRGVPELPTALYVDDSLSLRGNTYTVNVSVENQLGWSPQAGRLFSCGLQRDGKLFHLGILLPSDLGQLDIEKGQRFEVEVKVADHGLLEAIQLRKA